MFRGQGTLQYKNTQIINESQLVCGSEKDLLHFSIIVFILLDRTFNLTIKPPSHSEESTRIVSDIMPPLLIIKQSNK